MRLYKCFLLLLFISLTACQQTRDKNIISAESIPNTDLLRIAKSDIDEVIDWADAINVLRIQRERMGVGIIPSIREYRSLFGITSERICQHKKEIIIMHPGPMNRGVEIDSAIADGEQAIILDQVLNGVAVRMSILFLLLTSGEEAGK